MQPLDQKYFDELAAIAAKIEASESLNLYLEEEEEEAYKTFQAECEPMLAELHQRVTDENPLQLVPLEQEMAKPHFEGLLLPRILGYAVLRGEVSSEYRYVRPNDHFKKVLLAVCESPYFETLKMRVGQAIKTGFTLSSDIWITSVMNSIENKRIRGFLQAGRTDIFLTPEERAAVYNRYLKQFKNELFRSADFPENRAELEANYSALKLFLMKRIAQGGNTDSLREKIQKFLNTEAFFGTKAYLEVLSLYGNFMMNEKLDMAFAKTHFDRERAKTSDFDTHFLEFLLELYENIDHMSAVNDQQMSLMIDSKVKDRVSDFYRIADKVHALGYVHADTIDAVQDFYNHHKGMSIETECLHAVIKKYFSQLLKGLSPAEYTSYIDLHKIFRLYMKTFDNQRFTQSVERMSVEYVKRLLRFYKDKRSKEYQEIKKFVATEFVELGFMNDKQVAEWFKTPRKKKVQA
jgi:hypothetical protein